MSELDEDVTYRPYVDSDYESLRELYQQPMSFGGQFDEDRDSRDRLKAQILEAPWSVLVAEREGKLVGSVSLIEDKRVAWLFRFAVLPGDVEVSKGLFANAQKILAARGHRQVLVYSPVGADQLDKRYYALGFHQGNAYTAWWMNLD